jgi:hypothetical protein
MGKLGQDIVSLLGRFLHKLSSCQRCEDGEIVADRKMIGHFNFVVNFQESRLSYPF